MPNDNPKVFVSVGRSRDRTQDDFVEAVESRIKAQGLVPCTVGRNYFTDELALKAVVDLMKQCHGAVIIAFERYHYPSGTEFRDHGQRQKALSNVRLPTVWNQTEAAMAYVHGLPTLLVIEDGLREEGFFEHEYPWPINRMTLATSALGSERFAGAFAGWARKVNEHMLKSPLPIESGAADKPPIKPIAIDSANPVSLESRDEAKKTGRTVWDFLGSLLEKRKALYWTNAVAWTLLAAGTYAASSGLIGVQFGKVESSSGISSSPFVHWWTLSAPPGIPDCSRAVLETLNAAGSTKIETAEVEDGMRTNVGDFGSLTGWISCIDRRSDTFVYIGVAGGDSTDAKNKMAQLRDLLRSHLRQPN